MDDPHLAMTVIPSLENLDVLIFPAALAEAGGDYYFIGNLTGTG